MKPPTNKLSIYLLREDHGDASTILKGSHESLTLSEVGTFYFQQSATNAPGWVQRFFGDELQGRKLFTAVAKAVFLIRVQMETGVHRHFAVTFGHGWQLLNPSAIEERFGLKTVVNTVKPDSLRRIDRKNLSYTSKDTHEQVSQASNITAFAIDIEQDLVRGMTGLSKNEVFGKVISGRDGLSVSVPVDHHSIHDFLRSCYEQYISDDYKTNFGWIDHIAEVKNRSVIARLDADMVQRVLAEDPGTLWMSVPDLIDWDDFAGFKYRQSSKAEGEDDIGLLRFLASLSDSERASLDTALLKDKMVYCYAASINTPKHRWRAYNCIYCESYDEQTQKTYLLSHGKWFEVDNDFTARVNSEFTQMRDAGSSISLPLYSHDSEADYNKKVSEADSSFYCLDRDTINHGGGYSSVEFCDLIRSDRKFIHVKRYGSSSVLSHLFAQGVVPGELFATDAEFRGKLNSKLPDSHKLGDPVTRPTLEDYEIIYGIMSKKDEALEIPFFSKVVLRNAKRRLGGYGYKVSLQKVKMTSPT